MLVMNELLQQMQQAIDSGMAVNELAARAGCTRQYIHAIMTRKQSPSLNHAEKLAKALGFSLEFRRIDKKSKKIPA